MKGEVTFSVIAMLALGGIVLMLHYTLSDQNRSTKHATTTVIAPTTSSTVSSELSLVTETTRSSLVSSTSAATIPTTVIQNECQDSNALNYNETSECRYCGEECNRVCLFTDNQCTDFKTENCCNNMTITFTADVNSWNETFNVWDGQTYKLEFIYDSQQYYWIASNPPVLHTSDILEFFDGKHWLIRRRLHGSSNLSDNIKLSKLSYFYKGCPSRSDYYRATLYNDWNVTCND